MKQRVVLANETFDSHAFLIALEIDPIELHHVYKNLPRHCTVMHWFRISGSAKEVLKCIRPVIAESLPIELVAGESSLFGPDRDIPVHVIRPAKSPHDLHMRLLEALSKLPIDHTSPYVGADFHPHVTTQKREGTFPIGSKYVATNAYLIEAHDPEHIADKGAVAKIPLGLGKANVETAA
jgi:2'-5' RNA ligase